MQSATSNQTLEESKHNVPETQQSELYENLVSSSNLDENLQIPQIEYLQTEEQEQKQPNHYFNADYVSEDEEQDHNNE